MISQSLGLWSKPIGFFSYSQLNQRSRQEQAQLPTGFTGKFTKCKYGCSVCTSRICVVHQPKQHKIFGLWQIGKFTTEKTWTEPHEIFTLHELQWQRSWRDLREPTGTHNCQLDCQSGEVPVWGWIILWKHWHEQFHSSFLHHRETNLWLFLQQDHWQQKEKFWNSCQRPCELAKHPKWKQHRSNDCPIRLKMYHELFYMDI